MKTLLFCTSYFDDIEKYKNWAKYYLSNKENLLVDDIFMIDDGSKNLNEIKEILGPEVQIYSFDTHLGRESYKPVWDGGKVLGWLRSFLYCYNLAIQNNYEKIIHIEADFYLFNFDKIKNITKGWHLPVAKPHSFPETAIQVICKDKFNELEEMNNKGLSLLDGSIIENKFKDKSILNLKGIRWENSGGNRWQKDEVVPLGYEYVGQIYKMEQLKKYLS